MGAAGRPAGQLTHRRSRVHVLDTGRPSHLVARRRRHTKRQKLSMLDPSGLA